MEPYIAGLVALAVLAISNFFKLSIEGKRMRWKRATKGIGRPALSFATFCCGGAFSAILAKLMPQYTNTIIGVAIALALGCAVFVRVMCFVDEVTDP